MKNLVIAVCMLISSVAAFAGEPCLPRGELGTYNVVSRDEIDVYTSTGRVVMQTSGCDVPSSGNIGLYFKSQNLNQFCVGDKVVITWNGDSGSECTVLSMQAR